MTNGDRERLAEWAVIALLVVALAGVAGGITVAYLGGAVAAVVAVTTAAVGGIIAIVLRDN